MKAVLLVSHGSYSSQTKLEVEALVEELKSKLRDHVIEYAFLEIDHPSIPEGIDNCVQAGCDEIIVALNFLNAGRHVDKDIPAIIDCARKKCPEIKVRITTPVGQHKRIAQLFKDLIEEC